MDTAEQIQIIGGADGPTAILIAAPGDGSLIIAAGLLVLIIVALWLYGRRRKYQKN